MIRSLFVIALLLLASAAAFPLTAEDVLARIDNNRTFSTESFQAKMTLERGAKKSVKNFRGYGQSDGNRFYMEFSNPEDRGVKYLRLDSDLWIWLPDAGDKMKISGHMLRQGMMGSDLSYEDMLSGDSWRTQYTPSLSGNTNIGGAECVLLDLTAKTDSAPYYRRRIAVDMAGNTAPLLEFYAKSGRILKIMTQEDFRQLGGRKTAFRFTVSDLTRGGSKTVIEFSELRMDEALPSGIFSLQNLRK